MEAANTTQAVINAQTRVRLVSPFTEFQFFLLEVILRVFINGILAAFGLFSNATNIVVFYRQGILSHSSIVNLTALAVSDFICCLFTLCGAVFGGLDHFNDTSKWSWSVHSFFIFTSMRPYNTFTQVTSWITTFLAFERAMSVVFPFMAKNIFNPKRSLVIVILIFVVNIFLNTPSTSTFYLGWKVHSKTNRSYLTFIRNPVITVEMIRIFFYTCPVTLRFLSIIIVVVCNLIIVWKVSLSQNFRKSSAPTPSKKSSDQTNDSVSPYSQEDPGRMNDAQRTASKTTKSVGSSSTSTKEIRLLRMIILLSIIFIICYMTSVAHVVGLYLFLTLEVDYHWELDIIVLNIVNVCQTLNASINIIIYYAMSTRFREELRLCMKVGKQS